MTITKSDMARQVRRTLDPIEGEYDVDGIVDDIHAEYGLVDIDTVPHSGYWLIVARNARPDEAPRDWFFTFGVGHPLYSKKYVKINGTYEGAREIMFEVFGRNWSHQYDEAGKAKSIDRYGLTELQ